MIYSVVGNRTGWDYETIRAKLIDVGITTDDIIVSGGAEGVDSFANSFAKEIGCSMVTLYPNVLLPSPERYFERNTKIAEMCDVLIAFDKKKGRSGTKNTINTARKLGREILWVRC